MANHTSSDRLYLVLNEQQISVMGFANLLDLPMTGSEQLYSILHGEEQITKDLAERINALLPQYSVEWLLGEGTAECPQSI